MHNGSNVKGKVYWLTGLSGAGKTTIGKKLYENIYVRDRATVFLDGDTLRQVFGDDLGYTYQDRNKSAMRNARLCKMLSDMGITVICATISMFNEVRRWNREYIENYYEIYLKVSMDILMKRNQKGLYNHEQDNLVGFGVNMEEPQMPDMVVLNDGSVSPIQIAEEILKMCPL